MCSAVCAAGLVVVIVLSALPAPCRSQSTASGLSAETQYSVTNVAQLYSLMQSGQGVFNVSVAGKCCVRAHWEAWVQIQLLPAAASDCLKPAIFCLPSNCRTRFGCLWLQWTTLDHISNAVHGRFVQA